MRICLLGNYPPRKCGIATFTHHLGEAIMKSFAESDQMTVIAMDNPGFEYEYPNAVSLSLKEEIRGNYSDTAVFINQNADILLIQHEFGIFGGRSGVFLLQLLEHVHVPVVITLHTVLKRYDFHQMAVMSAVFKKTAALVVMSRLARRILTEKHKVPEAKVHIIEHGTPDFSAYDHHQLKKEIGWEGKKSLITFGLIGRNKGIETVIRAMPEIIRHVPDFQYVVLGKTHPSVVKEHGEEYREFLMQTANQLGVEGHLVFIDEYVSEENLVRYLKAADFYVTPYLNEAQITSGTLVYAMASGCLVFSSPYWHAAEALENGRGYIFPLGDDRTFSGLFLDAVRNPDKSEAVSRASADYGYSIRWEKAGKRYYDLLQGVLNGFHKPQKRYYTMPDISYRHLFRMTDTTGIIQHSNYSVPDKKLGYCLDDNARALIVALNAWEKEKDERFLDLVTIYLSYILYVQNKDGDFRNFLDYSRKSYEHAGSEDSFGRTLWALGYLIAHPPSDGLFQLGLDVFFKALPHTEKLHHLRGLSNAMIGLYWAFKRFPDHEGIRMYIHKISNKLLEAWRRNSSPDWRWFEEILTYDNAIMPYALLLAAESISSKTCRDVALESLEFLTSQTMLSGHLSLIGNGSWMKRGAWRDPFGQQPIDALAMIMAYSQKYKLTKSHEDFEVLEICAEWFLGRNDLLVPMYDQETGGCNDGLEEFAVNRNQGAESLVAWLLSAQIFTDLA